METETLIGFVLIGLVIVSFACMIKVIDAHRKLGEDIVSGYQEREKEIMSDLIRIAKKMGPDEEENDSLGELLAIIHGDGGHYQAAHGTEKTIEEAIKIVYDMRNKEV